jgi:ectoine hydroxylase-related dioxygenase (phytanoyl-CoA dioxygenase family)
MADTDEVTEAQIAAYRRDGAVLIKGALKAADVALLTKGLEESAANPGDRFTTVRGHDGQGETLVEQLPSLDCPSLRELMHSGALARLAGTVMNVRSAQLVFDQVFYKKEGRVVPTPWHQDTPFMRVRGDDLVRVWLSADPSPRDLTVQVVRGSHRWNVVYDTRPGGPPATRIAAEGRGFTYDGIRDASAPPVPDVAGYRDSFDILQWDVEPGDALLFNANVLHGADGREHHAGRRRAFASVWAGPDARSHTPPGHAVPSVAEMAGFSIPHGACVGDHEDAYPVGWRRAADERRVG